MTFIKGQHSWLRGKKLSEEHMTPVQESCYFLLNENKEPVALIRNKIMYSVDPLDNDSIAMLFNGNERLPLIPNQLNKTI